MVRRAIGLLVLAACAEPSERPAGADPPVILSSGEYRFELTNSFFWTPGPELTLEPDGSYHGHPAGTLWGCEGMLTAAELDRVTDALNGADLLSRPQPPPARCADHAIYHFEVGVVDGAAVGTTRRLTYEPCNEEDHSSYVSRLVV